LREQGTPATPLELHRHQTVTHTAQGPAVTWTFAKAGKPLEITVRSQLAANTSALVHHALLSGAGIGMLSCPLAAADVAKGDLVEVLAPFASTVVHTMFAVSLPSRRNAARVPEGFNHFVTSIVAPVASGWSCGRVGSAPTGKRRLITAHTQSGHSSFNCLGRDRATTS
jgi:DNA-binding transcriptional LysR family regulator